MLVPHSLCQEQLPATGVPITRQRFDQMRSMFDEYVRSSTLQNWKFWIVSFGASACSLLRMLHQTPAPLLHPLLLGLWGPSSSRGSGGHGEMFPSQGHMVGHAEMLRLGGTFCHKGANPVGVNGQSLGKSHWQS